jgi:hypothetical protein
MADLMRLWRQTSLRARKTGCQAPERPMAFQERIALERQQKSDGQSPG